MREEPWARRQVLAGPRFFFWLGGWKIAQWLVETGLNWPAAMLCGYVSSYFFEQTVLETCRIALRRSPKLRKLFERDAHIEMEFVESIVKTQGPKVYAVGRIAPSPSSFEHFAKGRAYVLAHDGLVPDSHWWSRGPVSVDWNGGRLGWDYEAQKTAEFQSVQGTVELGFTGDSKHPIVDATGYIRDSHDAASGGSMTLVTITPDILKEIPGISKLAGKARDLKLIEWFRNEWEPKIAEAIANCSRFTADRPAENTMLIQRPESFMPFPIQAFP